MPNGCPFQSFKFELLISQLPRSAKICIGIYEKKRSHENPLFWVNTNLFDYKGKLKSHCTLHLWKYHPGSGPTYYNLSHLGSYNFNFSLRGHACSIIDCF